MESRVCYPMTNVPEYLIGTVTAPSGGLKPGDVVVVSVADNSIEKNYTQYYASKPTEDTLKGDTLAIVISGGNFEDLVDGRFPDGNPDYTTYVYEEGKTAPVLFLESRVMVYISDDCFSGNVNIGDVVSGVAGENKLSVDGDGLTKLSVEAKHEFRVGGVFGSSFITGNVCRVLPSGGAGSSSRNGSLFIWNPNLVSANITNAETGDITTVIANEDTKIVEIPEVPIGEEISTKYSSIELSDDTSSIRHNLYIQPIGAFASSYIDRVDVEGNPMEELQQNANGMFELEFAQGRTLGDEYQSLTVTNTAQGISAPYPTDITLYGTTYSMYLWVPNIVNVGNLNLDMINKSIDGIYLDSSTLGSGLLTLYLDYDANLHTYSAYYTTNLSPYSGSYDTTGEPFFIKSLEHNGVPIYVWGDDTAGSEFTRFDFFVKNPQASNVFFLFSLQFDYYIDYSSETELPQDIANYIDCYKFYVGGIELELSDYILV